DYPLDLISGVGCGSLLHRSLQLQPTEESVMPKLVQPGPVYSENN
ncbi:hypothetical protein YPPY47_2865, partial [Yersinia pestis PY-47]